MNLPRIGAACAALLLIPALASCTSDPGSPTSPSSSAAPASPSGGNPWGVPAGGAELADTNWVLEGAAWGSGNYVRFGITLDFAADSAGGSGGVNTYTAGYTSTPDGALTFSNIASTAMAGDDAAMEAEAAYLAALKTVTGYTVSGGGLGLFGEPDQAMVFRSANSAEERGTTPSSER